MSDTPQNGKEPGAEVRAEEATLTAILQAKMQQQNCLQEGDQQAVAYRISEIMVAAKELYTKDLPRLMQEDLEAAEGEMFQELAGLRMALFNLRDLITDFDEAFLDAMTHQRDEDEEDGDDDGDDDDEDETASEAESES